MSTTDPYLLGYSRQEQERLERQAGELALESAVLFDRVGLRAGARVVEIGCGPRGCLALLAERVGAAGRVVGVERSAEQVARARRFVAEAGLLDVEVVEADARRTGLPAATFDLATARLVLVNVPQPVELVTEMVRLVRAGGVVALHEADATTQVWDPPLPAWTRALELLDAYAARNGIDRSIGRKLPRLLREAGLVDVGVDAFVQVYGPGNPRRMLPVQFLENVRGRLVAQGLADAAEVDDVTTALRRHLEDAETLFVSSVFVQAWGRKPA